MQFAVCINTYKVKSNMENLNLLICLFKVDSLGHTNIYFIFLLYFPCLEQNFCCNFSHFIWAYKN